MNPQGDDPHTTRSRGEKTTPRRRDFLVGAGATAALLLAGCSEGGSGSDGPADDNAAPEPTETTTRTYQDPTPNLDITSFTPRTEEGKAVVDVTVENVGDESTTATLVVITTVENETVEREQRVSLEPGVTRQYTLEFDLPAENVSDIDAIDFSWKTAT